MFLSSLLFALSICVGVVTATWPHFQSPLDQLNLNISDFLGKHGEMKPGMKLRGASLSKSGVNVLDESFLSGFIEVTTFSDQTSCSGPVIGKYFYELNQCGVFLVSGLYVKYVMQEENDDEYKFGALIFSDSACGNKITESFTVLGKRTCASGSTNTHRPTLPDLDSVGLSVILGAYEDATSCASNTDSSKFVGVSLMKKNSCLKGASGDIFINGCDINGNLVGAFYKTTDGTCKGTPTDLIRLAPGADCNNLGTYGPLSFGGYRNFKCLA